MYIIYKYTDKYLNNYPNFQILKKFSTPQYL